MTRSRKLLWSAGGLTGLVLFLLVCGLVLLRSGWFREQVRQRIVVEVEAATGGRVEIGEFRFDWAQLRAEVRPFVLHGTEKAGEPPLFSAGSVQVGLRIVSMLRRDVDIDSLAVVEPRLRVVVYPDGRTNLPQPPVVRRHRKPMEAFLALAIGRFRVERGLIEIDTRRIPLEVRGENLSAHASYDASGPRYDGDVSFRKLYVTAPSVLSVGVDADISASLEADRVSIRSARLVTGRSSAQVTGAVEDLLSPRVNLNFDAKVFLAELRSYLKSPVAAAGTLNLTGKVSYARASGYAINARASGAGLSAESARVKLTNLRISSDVEARPDRLTLSRLSVGALGGSFSGRASVDKLKRFRLGGELQDISIAEVARLRKIPAEQWDGQISGPVEIEGELASAGARNLKATAKLAVHASGQGRPVEGLVDLSYDEGAKRLEFGNSYLSTPASRVEFQGALNQRMRADFTSTDLNDLLPAAAYLGGAAPASLPVTLRNGTAKFSGTVTGGLEKPLVAGQLHVSNFSIQGRAFDRLDTFVSLSESSVEASKLTLDQGGARLQGSGRAALRSWKPDETGSVAGSFTVAGLQVDKLAAEAGSKIQVRGVVAGTIQLAGTPREPVVKAGLSLTQAEAFGQRLDLVRAQFRYAARSLSAESFQLNSGTARLRGAAVYTHRAENWKSGSLKFEASGKSFPLAEGQAIAGFPKGVEGDLDLQVRGEASAQDGKLLPTLLQGTFFLRKVSVDKKPLGDMQLTAETKGGWLELAGTGDLAGAKIKANARYGLQGNHPTEGKVSFSRTPLSALWPWLPASAKKFPLGAFAEGTLTFSGAGLEPANWSARLEMPTVEIVPPPELVTQVTGLRNEGPVLLAVSKKEIRIQSARFVGTGTNLEVSGRIDTATRYNAYDVRIRGAVNLAILHNFDPNLTASGNSSIDASIRGPRSKPEIYGRLELKKSSFYLSGVPNGIDNASGVIFFFRDRATIENLTAETGGGKLALKGFIGLGATGPNYRLQATVSQVRVRYPEGVSTSFDASLDVTGTARRSLVSGTVTILRSSFSQNIDLGGLLARSSRPLVTPAIQNELLRGMQFDVRVEAAPNARFDTMLTRDIQAEADLRLRGTPYKPVLLGRISINQGEVNFLGNRYSIGRGEISFLNPVRLEPVLNLDLSTRVRGIDVTMSFTGPIDRLNVTYRSDPPLQITEIIALLAVGRAPTSDPALLARQSERDQSWQQIGASTLVGQALAAPVAGRLQRFFGVSRIKIDPKLTGFGNNPGAQITMEQQVSRDITFTYVTSLAQEQQQLVRVEWNVSRRWSLVAVREETGLFGIEVQFRRQFK